ncbi:signal peptidase I [Candidatus Pacearchaeota archaeon]|nr:signal peptidase I [Candidatus Pacearchaeota archaeon]
MNKIKIIEIFIIFIVGFLSGSLILANSAAIELPALNYLFRNSTPAPLDHVAESNIKIYNDRVIIYVNDASLSSYASTGSMRPVLDEGSNGIRIKPQTEDEIQEGDIVTFRRNNLLIVHRVVEKGTDEEGFYFIAQGDNNSIADGKIRFNDIEWKTIGVIY